MFEHCHSKYGSCHPRSRREDQQSLLSQWIPAFAGTTWRVAYWIRLGLTLITIITLFASFHAKAETREVKDLTQVREAIKHAGPETLLVFDVKDVLFLSRDLIRRSYYRDEYKKLVDELRSKYGERETERLISQILLQESLELVDKKILSLIEEAERQGVKTVALTSGFSGRYGDIEKREDLRLKTLAALGISFKLSFPSLSPFKIDNIKSNPEANGCVMFKGGVIFACRASKGEVLEKFLEKAGYLPKKIIFVDNRSKHTKTIEELAARKKIEVKTFLYTAVQEYAVLPLRKEHILFQFNYLEKYRKWLSDEQVVTMLRENYKRNKNDV